VCFAWCTDGACPFVLVSVQMTTKPANKTVRIDPRWIPKVAASYNRVLCVV
jgi:hypothetical protein